MISVSKSEEGINRDYAGRRDCEESAQLLRLCLHILILSRSIDPQNMDRVNKVFTIVSFRLFHKLTAFRTEIA